MKINKNKKGFTLTELIIVIVIIGILAAILIPSLSSYIKKAKISKGEQNARNMTSLLIGEVLFNDKEFLMPEDVKRVVAESGYDLISEVENYAYWYDTETNTIKYLPIEDTITKSVSADDGVEYYRGRIEQLSDKNPNLYYIDQTPNALSKAISTINNLVKNALSEAGLDTNNLCSEAEKAKLLDAMDNKVYALSDDISSMKKLSSSTKNLLIKFVNSFNTTDTIYYDTTGLFNKQLLENSSEGGVTAADILVQRAMVTDQSVGVPFNNSYGSISITVAAPIIIPSSATGIDPLVLGRIKSGHIYLSPNSTISASDLQPGVIISTIASINSISYTELSIVPKYDLKEYRFRNGLMFTIKFDEELFIDENGVLITKRNNNTYKYYTDPKDGKYLTWMYDNAAKQGTYYAYSENTEPINADGTLKGGVNLTQNNIISVYYVPTVEVSDGLSGLNFSDFVSTDKLGKGNISLRTTNSMSSVKYTAVMVTDDFKGYRIDNIGYITDILYDIYQQREVKEDNITSYTLYGNTEAKISCHLPAAAKSFRNLSNISIKVSYKLQHVEYEERIIGDKTFHVSTGVVYEEEDSVSNHEITLSNGNSVEGFNDVVDLTDRKFYCNGISYQSNQIKITKITVTINGDKRETLDLFIRYFE